MSSVKCFINRLFFSWLSFFLFAMPMEISAQLGGHVDPTVYLYEPVIGTKQMDTVHFVNCVVLDEDLNVGPVSPLLPGYLFEMGYGEMESGLWAEMIFNRHFETFPAYKPNRDWWYGLRTRDKEKGYSDLLSTDWREMDWYHSGYEHNSWYTAPGKVNDNFINEESSFFQFGNQEGLVKVEMLTEKGFSGQYARVENKSLKNGLGIAQNGKYLRKGVDYTFKGYFRSVKGIKNVKVSLFPQGEFKKAIASVELGEIDKEWQQKTAHFKDNSYEGFVTLLISLAANSTIDMDALSLMPDDAINGWRKDVVDMVREEIKPGVLRWPGGCYASHYFWKDGIGDRDKRPVKVSAHWGGFAFNDTGTLEFLDFCELTGAEPFICLNLYHPMKENYIYFSVDGKTVIPHGYHFPEMTNIEEGARHAAEWVAYCNLPVGRHPMANLRKEHGRRYPAKVIYWELDNEAFRWFSTAEQYAHACFIYAKAMKAIDPEIKLGMCTYGGHLSNRLDTMLQIAGLYIDFLADRGTTNENIERKIKIIREYNKKNNTNIKYTNTEYFVDIYDSSANYALKEFNVREGKGRNLVTATWGYALSWANLLMQWQRYGSDVLFTCFNSFVNDHMNSVIETPKECSFLKYPAAIGKLFRESPARYPLRLQGYCPDTGKSLQIQVAWNFDRTNLVVYLYNSMSVEGEVTLNLSKVDKAFLYSKTTCIQGPKMNAIRSVKVPGKFVETKTAFSEVEISKNGIWTTFAPPESFVQVELSETPFYPF